MRLIDADALIPIMKYTTTDNEIGVFPIRIGFDAIKGVIDNAPTADVVEVVRCKDCKHRTELPYVDKDTHEPIYDCGYNISAIWGEENGYCNHGERRE